MSEMDISDIAQGITLERTTVYPWELGAVALLSVASVHGLSSGCVIVLQVVSLF